MTKMRNNRRFVAVSRFWRGINSADDERNPPETGIEVEAMKRVKNGKAWTTSSQSGR
jgi:hypothetical protein